MANPPFLLNDFIAFTISRFSLCSHYKLHLTLDSSLSFSLESFVFVWTFKERGNLGWVNTTHPLKAVFGIFQETLIYHFPVDLNGRWSSVPSAMAEFIVNKN